MRRICLSGLFLLTPLWSADVPPADRSTGAADLIRMHQGGLKDDTILDFLRATRASVRLSEPEFLDLAKAGLHPDTLRALRGQAQARPPQPPSAGPAGPRDEAPLPRFYVGYPHDPAAFPAWYVSPSRGEGITTSQQRGGIRVYGGGWRPSGGWARRGLRR